MQESSGAAAAAALDVAATAISLVPARLIRDVAIVALTEPE
jgi:hypothetical protein